MSINRLVDWYIVGAKKHINHHAMNRLITLLYSTLASITIQAQITLPADGNKKASVSEDIGITTVKIEYSRPGVKGREGQIWGKLVHYGFADLHYGTSKAAPWRAGANENTTVEFSTDVAVEGKPLTAGKYGFFIAMGPERATVVFSKFSTAWGSFYYDSSYDALRVEVPVVKTDESVERLKYEFSDQTDSSAVVALYWEKVKIPFTVSVDLVQRQIDAFRREFNSGMFYRYWQNMQTAADYCLTHNVNLEEGLQWAERSINSYFGEANFLTLSTYAGLLAKFDRKREADSLMKKAIPMGTPLQLLIYGDHLNKQKQYNEAMKIFQVNYNKNPTNDYAILGMVMGNYFLNKKEEAIKTAEKGTKSADPNWSGYFKSIIADLKSGKEMFK